jgi:hypothetical protein
MPSKKPWQRFRVGSRGTKGGTSPRDCQRLTKVSHIAHLEQAHRIIVEGKVRSGLVFDESKLNKKRILVTWLSPNIWRQGYRYGSIRFVFDWPTLYKGHRAYWVESIAYGVEACRILVTRNDHSKSDLLIPYDPTEGDGPWWLDEESGTHYWNGKYCLEFMIEHDIETSELRELNFVWHHPQQCSIDSKNCPERGLGGDAAGGRFLAQLAASKSTFPPSAFNKSLLDYASVAFGFIDSKRHLLGEFEGDFSPGSPGWPAIARALLNAYANPMLHDDIPYLARLFRDRDALKKCCLSLIRAAMKGK